VYSTLTIDVISNPCEVTSPGAYSGEVLRFFWNGLSYTMRWIQVDSGARVGSARHGRPISRQRAEPMIRPILGGLPAGLLAACSPSILTMALPVFCAAILLSPAAVATLMLGFMLSFAATGALLAPLQGLMELSPLKKIVTLNADELRCLRALFVFGYAGLLVLFSIPGGTSRSQQFSDVKAWISTTSRPVIALFCIGLLLGTLWSPPPSSTLNATYALTGTGQGYGVAFLTLLFFAFGATLPLIPPALIIPPLVSRHLNTADIKTDCVFGGFLACISFLAITGWDRTIESWLLNIAPEWLSRLSSLL
jgi:cytochrome c-type biogenesis protein